MDGEGRSLAVGLLREELETKPKRPKARKRTTIHVDGLLKERFEAFGQGTHKEKMVQLLDAAERNERLERQLHNAQQRLKVARDHIELLQKKQAAPTKPSSFSAPTQSKKSDSPTERHRQRLTEESDRQRPQPQTHTPIPDDWTEMGNAELNGSQIPGSADEKIRRSIEAFYAYNEERAFAEQWSITPTVVQKLSGSNANRVKDYLLRHADIAKRLEKYNKDYGYQQNRGKGDPRETVKWPASYGAYEW